MVVGITNDHRGYKLKQKVTKYLQSVGYNIIDYGALSEDSVDFPCYAFKLGDAIINKDVDLGIAICGTGIGMSIALNKMKGIYCAKVSTKEEAKLCREHNNANVIAVSENVSDIEEIINNFINTKFLNEDKYLRRNQMIKDKENV